MSVFSLRIFPWEQRGGCSLRVFHDVFDQLASRHGILPCFLLPNVTFDVSVLKKPRGFAFAYAKNGSNLIERENFGIVAFDFFYVDHHVQSVSCTV